MSLPNYLASIKSAGIYRFVWDKSEIKGAEAETLRLVVGYSEKGPFNTLVYVKTPTEFKNIYGDISKKLERRGIFFHRMAIQALAAGPVLCLNLKKFSQEQVDYLTANPTGSFTEHHYEEAEDKDTKKIVVKGGALVEKVFNTTRFWNVDPDVLPSNLGNKDQYISIAATDSLSSSNTIFMRGYKPTGYNVTVKSWYTQAGEDIPSYLEGYEDMMISDFFAEVYVFKGEFTKALAASEEFKKYFDIKNGNILLKPYIKNAFGEKQDTLGLLANDENSNFINVYRGCLLPYFKGNNGAYISLDLLFNADNATHKMVMKMNADLLYNETLTPMDITTRGWDQVTEKVLLKSLANLGLTEDLEVKGVDCFSNTDIFPHLALGEYKNKSWNYTKSENIIGDPDLYLYELSDAITNDGSLLINKDFESVGFAEGDRFLMNINVGTEEVVFKPIVCALNKKEIDGDLIRLTFSNDQVIPYTTTQTVVPHEAGKVCIAVKDSNTNGYACGDYETHTDINGYAYWLVPIGVASGIQVTKNSSPVWNIVEVVENVAKTPTGEDVELPVMNEKRQWLVKCNDIITDEIFSMSPIYMKGYNFLSAKPAGGSDLDKLNWQKDILSALVDYEGLRVALTNHKDSEWRYLVDTFESFVDESLKSSLSYIVKLKDNAFGLLNFPAIQTFIDCSYSYFTDTAGRFNMKYIKEGANKLKPSAKLFSLPMESEGASWAGFFTPLTFSDGTVKTVVPSAALVSNTFMNKYTTRHPYDVVAGPNYSRLIYNGLVGPDYNFSREDLDILEPMGVNAIVYVPRQGSYINSNKTAKQNPVTTLSAINVRELVIFIQDEIEKILSDYQWEFNTQTLRDRIKEKADSVLETIKANGGIYAYQNVCDESNNTDDIIDNEMLVLSTFIEPGRGAGKMIQELTLYKKGGLTSTVVG